MSSEHVSWVKDQKVDPDSCNRMLEAENLEEIHGSQQPSLVWWDLDNVPVPKRYDVGKVGKWINKLLFDLGFQPAEQIGVLIVRKNATNRVTKGLRSFKSRASSVDLTILYEDHKQVSDSKILSEMRKFLRFFKDPLPHAAMVMISGDKDFLDMLTALRDVGYRPFVVYCPYLVANDMKASKVITLPIFDPTISPMNVAIIDKRL